MYYVRLLNYVSEHAIRPCVIDSFYLASISLSAIFWVFELQLVEFKKKKNSNSTDHVKRYCPMKTQKLVKSVQLLSKKK